MKCFFCNSEVPNGRGRIECPICSNYSVSDIIYDRETDNEKKYEPYKYLISGLIREKNELGIEINIIIIENIMSMLNDPLIPKTIEQKLDKILLYYYVRTMEYGQDFVLNESMAYSIGYAHNSEEFERMFETLVNQRIFIKNEIALDGIYSFHVSFEGICRAEELMTTNIGSIKVFVAMGFKPDLISAHKEAIQPACQRFGFLAELVSENEHNGDITDKILTDIKTSKFVIVDFTYNNAGAYFEAGFAQGRGLEVIRTCNKAWLDEIGENGERNQLHFDINHYNFILWENNTDLKTKLMNRIGAVIL